MKDAALTNQRIIANAGSGKTYRLTTRYIELLARGVSAERIIALTFTRKAAGEFLDAIFGRLLGAAGSADKAAVLAGEIGFPGLKSADFLGFLRHLIDRLPRLALSTMDSFFGRIVRVFPFECGLTGDISILDAHFQSVTRRTVLSGLFRAHAASDRSFRELLDLLRRQNRNRQTRSVLGTLDDEIASLHEKFLLTPSHQTWGDPVTIWPEGPPFTGAKDLPRLTDEFEAALFSLHSDMEEKHRGGWEERLALLRRLRPGSDVPREAAAFAVRILAPPPLEKNPGHFEVKLSRKSFAFPETLRPLCESLGRAILALDLDSRADRSRALHELLAKFENSYARTVRAAGRLTFLDITGLLAASPGGPGKFLHAPLRQAIDYRLDATYDHWLLDEFQDTSRLQWQAIRELVDEVIQSDTGRRSFFYVGDTKQAIYSWRGGDPRLFDEIAEFYNSSGVERIVSGRPLDISRRSVPEILDMVNGVFGLENLRRCAAKLELPEQVLTRWESAWRDHRPFHTKTGAGCACWRTLDPGDDPAQTLDAEVARLLQEINPAARGLSCAVLLRTNRRVTSIVNALRAAGLEASAEGRSYPCADNELGAACLSLLRMIAHPADTFSSHHVDMTPLRSLPGSNPDAFRAQSLRLVREAGLSGALRAWLGDPALRGNAFLDNRADALIEAAEEFDQTAGGASSIDDFLEYAREFSSTDADAGGSIRVMTIHASKGLDFDITVLPEIEGVSLPSRRDDSSIHLHTAPDGSVRWGMELPPAEICEADPVLREAFFEDMVEDCYEKLCLYYVALTRARRGLYLFSTAQKAESKSRDFNRLLHLTFPQRAGEEFIQGNPAWHEEILLPTPESLPAPPRSFPTPGTKKPPVRRLSPSEGRTGSAARLFAADDPLARGRDIHAGLAKVSWLEEGLPSFDFLPPSTARWLESFLQSEAGRAVFTRPEGVLSLWREKAFDVLIEGTWISGVFDRVVLFDDHAEIYDFKTETTRLAENYRSQMEHYRQCLAVLTGLPEDRINTRLVPVAEAGEIASS